MSARTRIAREQGLTLVEVLVITAIIGILAAMLLPKLARPKEGAENVACISNLRNLGIAARLYADDNTYRLSVAEALPSDPRLGARPVLRICDVLRHYASDPREARSRSVFRCLSDLEYFYEAEGSSYRWNTNLNGARIDSGETFWLPAHQIENGGGWMPAGRFKNPVTRTPLLVDYEQFHIRRTLWVRNAAFMDGHVAVLEPPN